MLKRQVFFVWIMTANMCTSIVWCNTVCTEDKDVAEVFVPQHYGYSETGSYRFFLAGTKRITKSTTTICNSVVFPLHNLKREDCENCTTTLKLLSLADTSRVLSKGAIPDFPSFNILILNDLNISKISPGVFGKQNFRQIVLSGNKLIEIEIGTFNLLTKLQSIDLSFNKLKSLSTHCFVGLSDLKTLNVSNNELNGFSFDIFDVSVTVIDLLNLSFNKISNLNLNIDNKIQIDKLYFSKNGIKTFDFCPFNFSELDLSHNLLEFLNETPCDGNTNQNKLNLFDVSFNKISKLDQFYFKNASNLEYLFLNHNNISEIENGVFFDLNNLKKLNLSENYLQEFQHGTFDSLQNLVVLDLSFNNIKSIKTVLHALTNLKELYLQNNNITSIDTKQLMYNSKNLQKFSFYHNNFSCENLMQAVYYLKNHMKITNGNTRNASNIHGIACSDTQNFETSHHENFEIIKNDFENIISSMFKENKNKYHGDKDDLKDYFVNDFKKTNFYKYLENLRNPQSTNFQNNAEPDKLVEIQESENRNANVTVIIILVCIVGILISISNIMIYKVLKSTSRSTFDEVELLEE